jgi:hypothetical protein
VAVEDAERDLHRRVGMGLAVDDRGTELEHPSVEGVTGADLVDLARGGGAWGS